MFTDTAGPIETFEWGRYRINGDVHSADGEGVGKDICIVAGEVTAWDARQGHRLKPEMVTCVLGQDVSTLVIGTGVRGRIRVLKKTRKVIAAGGIDTLIIETTDRACESYNRLVREGQPVALLAHGTC